jgi:hypothetical protein
MRDEATENVSPASPDSRAATTYSCSIIISSTPVELAKLNYTQKDKEFQMMSDIQFDKERGILYF